MFERFTPEAIKVIMLAQEEARRLRHNFVGTEQLLLGIIGENKSHAAIALRACGLNLRAARIEVENQIGRGAGFVAVEIPFTPNAKRALEMGWKQAKQLKHVSITPEHLLMGILANEDGVALRVIEKLSSKVRVTTELEKCMGIAAGAAVAKYEAPAPPKLCHWCAVELADGAMLCSTCGKPAFELSKRCPKCAEVLWKEAVLCRFCRFELPGDSDS